MLSWRFIVLGSVLIFLAMAYSEYCWRFRSLQKIFKFLAFDGPRASAAEQMVHYLSGTTIFAVFNFLTTFILNKPLPEPTEWTFLWTAIIGGCIKESLDAIVDKIISKPIKKRDSIVDFCFWVLGGLTAPLLKTWL